MRTREDLSVHEQSRGRRLERCGATLLLVLVAVTVTGCTSTHDTSYRFVPSPAEVRVVVDDDGAEGSLRTLASITGVRRPVTEDDLPAAIEVRLRIENHTAAPARLRAGDIELIASNLVAFPSPVLVGPSVVEVAPGEWALVDVQFQFPVGEYPGPYELSGLNLQWIVEASGAATAQSVSFQRLVRERYPYNGGRWGVGVGYGTHGSGVGVRYGW